jgi:large subunit ribosomal protein L19
MHESRRNEKQVRSVRRKRNDTGSRELNIERHLTKNDFMINIEHAMINEEILKQIKPGAKVRIKERIKEGEKERLSTFEGLVIARKHGKQSGGTFTVRAILHEVGVEKVYPINSPIISKVEIVSTPKKVKRSKLYFIRTLSATRIREKLRTK